MAAASFRQSQEASRKQAELDGFLTSVKIGRGRSNGASSASSGSCDPTHTSLSGGRYYVSSLVSERFMDIYAGAVALNLAPALVERHRHVGPVVIDLDLRHTGPERLYSIDAHVKPFLGRLLAELGRLCELPTDAELCVLEKPAPRPAAKVNQPSKFKDGLHVMLPDIYTRPEVQELLRKAMLPHVGSIFCAIPGITNDAKDIYDEAVISRNGWMMYGSKKPEEPAPWRLTSVWKKKADGGEGEGEEMGEVWCVWNKKNDDAEVEYASVGDLARRFSIRRTDVDEADLTPFGEELLERLLEGRARQAAREGAAASATITPDVLGDGTPESEGLAELVLGLLSARRAVDYHPWVYTGMALYHTTGGRPFGLDLFKRFSARCADKFDAHEVESKWPTFAATGRRPSTARCYELADLRNWAKADAGAARYRAWKSKYADTALVATTLSDQWGPPTAASAATEHHSTASPAASSTMLTSAATAEAQAAKQAVADLLNTRLPSRLPRISANSMQLNCCADGRLLKFADIASGLKGAIDLPDEKTHFWGRTIRIDEPAPEFLGLAFDNVMLKGPLTYLHSKISSEVQAFKVSQPEEGTLRLKSANPLIPTEINVYDPHSDNGWFLIDVMPGTQERVTPGTRGLKSSMKTLRSQVCRAINAADRSLLFANNGFIGTLNLTINTTTSAAHDDDDDDGRSSFEQLRDMVTDHAKAEKLRKLDGFVWVPVEGCPCAYVQGPTYLEHLNDVLNDVRLYHSSTRLQTELVQYLTSYNPPDFANLVVDRELLSFPDGVLDMGPGPSPPTGAEQGEADAAAAIVVMAPTTTRATKAVRLSNRRARTASTPPMPRFHRYGSPEAEAMARAGRVARHHIDVPFEASVEAGSPVFDAMLAAQFGPAVIDALHVLLGRLFFPIRKHDNWQVVPWLVGIAGTGKSTLLEVVDAMFAKHTVSTMCGNNEKTFGLEGKYQSHLLIGRDMPHEMSKVLSQELMQSMVSGETVSVPRKGVIAVESDWHVPMIFAGNHLPDYTDNGGQIQRRLVVFLFRTLIKANEKDSTLCDRIMEKELPAIAHKVVSAYAKAVEQHKGRDFWSWCPGELLAAREEVATATSYVRRFLAVGPDDAEADNGLGERVWVRGTPDGCTSVQSINAAFRRFMTAHHRGVATNEKIDRDSLMLAGYDVRDDVNVCKACERACPGRCCHLKSSARRKKLKVAMGVWLERQPIGHAGEGEDRQVDDLEPN